MTMNSMIIQLTARITSFIINKKMTKCICQQQMHQMFIQQSVRMAMIMQKLANRLKVHLMTLELKKDIVNRWVFRRLRITAFERLKVIIGLENRPSKTGNIEKTDSIIKWYIQVITFHRTGS